MSAVSPAYPISTPVEFTVTSGGDGILCNAEGFSTGDTPTENIVVEFVVTNPSDLLFRQSLGTANTLERLAIGTVGDVLTVGGLAAVAQTQLVTTVADVADSLNGTYFLLNSPSVGYYVWFDTGAVAPPPDPGLMPGSTDLFMPPTSGNGRTTITVSIATGATAIAVATAAVAAISAATGGLAFLATNVGGTSPIMTIVNLVAGVADLAFDGALPTGFAFGAGAPLGVSPTIVWTAPVPGTFVSFLAEATTAVAASIAAGSTWVTLSVTEVGWDDATLPNHDASAIFTPATGVFAVPATGIYAISAEATFEGNSTGNGGGGITGRRAIRQARILNVTTGATMAFGETQTQARAENPSQIALSVANISVTLADAIVLQVRHDATSSLAMSVDEDGTPTQGPATYFSAHRVS